MPRPPGRGIYFLRKRLVFNGQVSAEIPPPASEEVKEGVRESVSKFGDAFAEMRRWGS
jgi:hypothetical protein